ncbi:MAG: hypothetical protein AAF569_07775 [Pseudomonadota bacterium]
MSSRPADDEIIDLMIDAMAELESSEHRSRELRARLAVLSNTIAQKQK